VESGEGIERSSGRSGCPQWISTWNPVKELKVNCARIVSLCSPAVWNPVKELKDFILASPLRKSVKWNPVKELKALFLKSSLELNLDVESGEGIERGGQRSAACD